MKKLLAIVLILILCIVLGTGGLLAAGILTTGDILRLLPGGDSPPMQTAREDSSRQPEGGTDLYSRLADHEPPSGDGHLLSGELPEDRVPDAASRYSFPARMYPYRAMLSADEQTAYDQVYANAAELYESLPLHIPISIDSVARVMSAVFYDHPELFWVETAYQYSYTSEGNVVALTLQYNTAAGDIATYRSRFDDVAAAVIAGARSYATPVEQEKYVHDYLLDNVSYDLAAPLNQSAYSALVLGESVCAGYARAFQYILLELGIPAYYVAGYAGEDHAWNIVALDDGYYHVDVAWDDPLGNESGRRYYNYFNITDSEIAEDHTRTDLSVFLPACTATGYSYRSYFGAETEDGQRAFYGARSLEEVGFTAGDAITSVDAYYAHCRDRLVELGPGTHTFSVLLSNKALLDNIFALTENQEALTSYVVPAAQQLRLNGYTAGVSLQGEELEGGYWLLTQQVQLEEGRAAENVQRQVDNAAEMLEDTGPPAPEDPGEDSGGREAA